MLWSHVEAVHSLCVWYQYRSGIFWLILYCTDIHHERGWISISTECDGGLPAQVICRNPPPKNRSFDLLASLVGEKGLFLCCLSSTSVPCTKDNAILMGDSEI